MPSDIKTRIRSRRRKTGGALPTDFTSTVETVPVADLTPYPGNARTHNPQQIQQIAKSIAAFGFVNPILADADGNIVAGDGRVAAARLLGLDTVPVIRIEHLSDAQLRAYRIADNRLAELAGWDEQILAIEFQHLDALEVDFDLEITGFATAEIDQLFERSNVQDTDVADEIPELEDATAVVSQLGDLWKLGAHRLFCGDTLAAASYPQLLRDETARMVFVDPPFNVRINGHVSGLGQIKHREFVMASGEMSGDEFIEFLTVSLKNLGAACADGALLYVAMDWRHQFELLTASRAASLALLNLCVWNKTNAGMGSFYRSKHELVLVFKHGAAAHINNIELGKHGRYRTNVWDYAGINSFRQGRLDELAMHPTTKSVALVADAIKDCTRRGDIVLDGFGGSGTTLIAAEKVGRIGRAIELDPRYVDVTLRRWHDLTGEPAVHAETGLTFDALREKRQPGQDPDAQEAGHD